MIGFYAAGRSSSTGQLLAVAGIGIAVGVTLLLSGRYQRRRARETGDRPRKRWSMRRIIVRPSRSWATAAKIYTTLGWVFTVAGALLLVEKMLGLTP